MTQEERWNANYEAVLAFIKENGRNLSKYDLEERRLYMWVKHQRKVFNSGLLKGNRIEAFKKLMEICEMYRRVNQYQ